jgi:uncharacterized protein YggE
MTHHLGPVVALALALSGAPARAAPVAPAPPPAPEPPVHGARPTRLVRVSGEGRVAVAPDVAYVVAGVETTGKALAPAVADAAARTRRVLDAVAKAGVAERDVQTTRHDVQAERPWVNGRQGDVTGYTVADEVRIKVRDLSKLGVILDRVVAVGSNTVRGLTFERDDPTPARADALARAVVAARVKAEAMAKAAGVTLGEPIALEEAGEARPIPVMQREGVAAARAAAAPVATGTLDVTAEVTVTFALR